MQNNSVTSSAPSAAIPSKPRLRRGRLLSAGLLLLFGAAAVLAWIRIPAKEAKAPPAPRRVEPIAVTGQRLRSTPFTEYITASGTLRADEAVDLQAEVSGRVVDIHLPEGKTVREGDVLVKIDDSVLRASLRRAEARRELGRIREKRLEGLVREGGVSRQEYEEAQGEGAVLEAEVEMIRTELARCEIRAPFDGWVGLRYVSTGAYVTPASRIATLQRLSSVKVDFSIPERYAPHVQPGAAVRFTVAGSGAAYTGEVVAVEPRIDVATRTVPIRAVCRTPDLGLFPGLFARVEFAVNQDANALLVPAIAVIAGLEERYVFVAREGKAERVRVRIGTRTPTQVQIIEGLQPGDLVLTSGVQQLRAGLSVRVIEPAS